VLLRKVSFRTGGGFGDIFGLTENAGHENAGHEFAIHDKYRTKIYYITVQCAFLLNF